MSPEYFFVLDALLWQRKTIFDCYFLRHFKFFLMKCSIKRRSFSIQDTKRTFNFDNNKMYKINKNILMDLPPVMWVLNFNYSKGKESLKIIRDFYRHFFLLD